MTENIFFNFMDDDSSSDSDTNSEFNIIDNAIIDNTFLIKPSRSSTLLPVPTTGSTDQLKFTSQKVIHQNIREIILLNYFPRA